MHRGRLSLSKRHDRRGASLVEFAIVLPVLIMLLFGAWEFGRIFDAWQISTNAAREGARYAVATTDDSVVQAQIQQYLAAAYGSRLNTGGGDITIDLTTFGGCAGGTDVTICRPIGSTGTVTVTVAAHVDIWAPAVAPLIGTSTFTVNAWSAMQQ